MKDRLRLFKFPILMFGLLLLTPMVSLATTKVLLLGDSLSSGYGLSSPGWVAQANQALAAQGHDVEIINDSISGDTTAGGVARINDSIKRTAPDWVMIELGGNDGLRGLPPKVIESNLQKMVDIATENGARTMLLGILMPPNYGKTYTDLFARTFVNIAEQNDAPLLPFFIGEVGGNPALTQVDRIHPNDEAQPIIRDRVVPFVIEALGL